MMDQAKTTARRSIRAKTLAKVLVALMFCTALLLTGIPTVEVEAYSTGENGTGWYRVVETTNANMRQTVGGTLVQVVPPSALVYVDDTSPTGNYAYATYNGQRGIISLGYARKVADSSYSPQEEVVISGSNLQSCIGTGHNQTTVSWNAANSVVEVHFDHLATDPYVWFNFENFGSSALGDGKPLLDATLYKYVFVKMAIDTENNNLTTNSKAYFETTMYPTVGDESVQNTATITLNLRYQNYLYNFANRGPGYGSEFTVDGGDAYYWMGNINSMRYDIYDDGGTYRVDGENDVAYIQAIIFSQDATCSTTLTDPSIPSIPSLYSFSGAGTQANPYRISSAADLIGLATNAKFHSQTYDGKYFVQTANIDLSSSNWSTAIRKFNGIYDGANYTISGMAHSSTDYAHWPNLVRGIGLFGQTSGATLKNINISGFTLTGSDMPAGAATLVCNAANTKIVNCHVTDSSVIFSSGLLGQVNAASVLVGEISGSTTVDQCSVTNSTVETYAADWHAGGAALVGATDAMTTGSITNCYVTGCTVTNKYTASSTDHDIGLLLGYGRVNTVIKDCWASGSASASGTGVGAIGRLLAGTASGIFTLGNSSFTGSSSTVIQYAGSQNIGSVNRVIGHVGDAYTTATLSHLYSMTTVTKSGATYGANTATTNNGADITSAQATGSTIYTNAGWSTDVWNFTSTANGGYPVLKATMANWTDWQTGKEYDYSPYTASSVTVSQDSALSVMFGATEVLPWNNTSVTLNFATITPAAGTTILMVPRVAYSGDSVYSASRSYYYYTCAGGETSINLTAFKALGTTTAYARPTTSTLNSLYEYTEGFFFIIDFANTNTGTGTVSLTYGSTTTSAITYSLAAKRTFGLSASSGSEIDDAFTVSYSTAAPSVTSGGDSYYTGRYARHMAIVLYAANGYTIPSDATLTVGGTVYRQNHQNQFIVPIDAIATGSKSMQLSTTCVNALTMTAELWVAGGAVDESPLGSTTGADHVATTTVTLTAKTLPSLKLSMDTRLFYTNALPSTATVSQTGSVASPFSATFAVLKKSGSTYAATSEVSISSDGKTLTLGSATAGTYRIVATIKEGSRTITTVQYNFLIADPPVDK